jgi:hypothetical protein
MTRRIKDLNEEISRWAFEILFKDNQHWKIAFTNPTAGPWKTIKATNSYGKEGEVYRFPLEETRPDIILYNDELEAILIVEAKDSLTKLVSGDQAEKSVAVVERLADILSRLDNNPYWNKRAHYPVYIGILWGSTNVLSNNTDISSVFDIYYACAQAKQSINKDFIFGIESLYTNGQIECHFHYKVYTPGQEIRCTAIGLSLK